MKILITGGAGFIGSAVVRRAIAQGHEVVNLDVLAYSANLANVASVADSPGYAFEAADICDAGRMAEIFARHRPDAVMHLAAESHNDRAIDGPLDFVRTNVTGTAVLLEAARAYWNTLEAPAKADFRFHHVSTDEVFGALGEDGAFTEETPYDPNSPYSASKAGADHLVRAWGRTYGLPVVITNCANNYGPFQFPEKLIPTVVVRAMEGKTIPVYGDGRQVRDWLHVDDHAQALLLVLQKGRLGETYCIGGDSTHRNLEVIQMLCAELDRLAPANTPHADKITFVADRPGHDFRYSIDAAKLKAELGWEPATPLGEGLAQTVAWYVENRDWWQAIRDKGFHSERLGLAKG
ncbi:MAG: dTDP-glucose 4,6-dehydratase [Phenylobacterium sp.]|uniref:dTDP-glucose 4,6-dehydratase n=1 Tax=Phenylobacterium sp. TaxID=1871053 RepID=UPI002735184A|nr:dTDP-glucose 4,6-dehydratase [Phenylobacterium sp.]MDP1643706.1 dTDP-glucose 4,6-dehydratase [Phenylobacterium sp.]MDP3118133.1 dTDP-glucose 4,6-dehydratase [Phenylobacterium sp.]MDP3383439.1 dTDP-glucose 4,6-dehydratase [Phenylobacterium sp.]